MPEPRLITLGDWPELLARARERRAGATGRLRGAILANQQNNIMNTSAPQLDTFKQPEHSDVWRGSYRGVTYKIAHWGKAHGYTPGGDGVWNYYVYIREAQAKDFGRLWLPDQLKRFTDVSPERVSHDYYSEGFPSIDMHGGITFYAKHGHSEGHRFVEVGCDYSHLWDHERGESYCMEDVFYDVRKTIDQLYADGLLVEATP